MLIHQHYSTGGEPRDRQLLAWRDHMRTIDIPVSRARLSDGFQATLDRYQVGGLMFLSSSTDPMVQTRSIARISTDDLRDYCFYAQVDGCTETIAGPYPRRTVVQMGPSILALDMNQPMRMERPVGRSRVLALFVPRTLVDAVLPEAEAIHGRMIDPASHPARLLAGDLAALHRNLAAMPAAAAHAALVACASLAAAAFGRDAGLSGNARAAVRAALFRQARRYIDDNLHESDLSPDSVHRMSGLSRSTLYRLFEQEGGIAGYIRNRRLRETANELARFPRKAISDIAYGLGFQSPADFNHAFRRAYKMSPREFRAECLDRSD